MDILKGRFKTVSLKSLQFMQYTGLSSDGMKPMEMVVFEVMWSVSNNKIVVP